MELFEGKKERTEQTSWPVSCSSTSIVSNAVRHPFLRSRDRGHKLCVARSWRVRAKPGIPVGFDKSRIRKRCITCVASPYTQGYRVSRLFAMMNHGFKERRWVKTNLYGEEKREGLNPDGTLIMSWKARYSLWGCLQMNFLSKIALPPCFFLRSSGRKVYSLRRKRQTPCFGVKSSFEDSP